jgi:hypothetical protein
MSDWRLQGQEKYLKDAVLIRKHYQQYREGWDHDHCEFCGAEFSLEDADALKFGYATPDNYRWICEECFQDFETLFNWKSTEINRVRLD